MKKILLKNTNLNWLLVNRFITMPFEILIISMMARYLEPEGLGKISYAISLTTIFSVITTFGLDNVIIKQIVEKKENLNAVLGTSILFRFTTSIIMVFVVNFYSFLRVDDKIIQSMIFILSLGYLFQSFKVVDYYFQATSKCKFTVISLKLSMFSGYFLKFIAIAKKMDLVVFAAINTISDIILALFNIIFFQKYNTDNNSIKNWVLNFQSAKKLVIDCWPLAVSALATQIYLRLDQVMLQEMAGNHECGIYVASVKIIGIWNFIINAFGAAFYPKLVQSKLKSKTDYQNMLQHYYIIMFWVALFFVLFNVIIGKYFVLMLYGEQFRASSLPLVISSWSLIASFLGMAVNHYLIAENFISIVLYQTIIGCGASVVLNLLLIPKYGAPGAAVAMVISFTITTFSYLFFSKTWDNMKILINVLNINKIKLTINKIKG